MGKFIDANVVEKQLDGKCEIDLGNGHTISLKHTGISDESLNNNAELFAQALEALDISVVMGLMMEMPSAIKYITKLFEKIAKEIVAKEE